MSETELDTTHGTVTLPLDGTASRTIRILKPLADVQAAWSRVKIPGNPAFMPAPEGRGVDVTVELDEDADADTKHLLSPYEGERLDQQLESALRDFKALLETGEIATVEGQSSGRKH